MRYLKLTLVVALALALTTQAWAVVLPAGVKVKFEFTNWDVGALYNPDPSTGAGTYYTNGTYDLTVDQGSKIVTPAPSTNPWESGWGIFTLDRIVDATSNTLVYWDAQSSAKQITGIFWDLADGKMVQDGVVQYIKGTGLKFAFYEDLKTNTQFAPNDTGQMTRPSWRDTKAYTDGGGGTVYMPFFSETWDDDGAGPNPAVNYDATDGKLLWTGNAVAGRAEYVSGEVGSPGTGLVDPNYTFYTRYNYANNSSDGGFYGDLGTVTYTDVDGAGNRFTNSMTGIDNDQFKSWYPGVIGREPTPADYAADFWFEFNASPFTEPAGAPAKADAGDFWLLESDDPVRGLRTPELPSAALMLIGLAPLGLAWLRRKKED